MSDDKVRSLEDKAENLLKIGTYTKAAGTGGQLSEIQLKTLRNLEDAFKMGQFGFNSKAPTGSRCVVAQIGNEAIVIANEHLASIIDVTSGNTIIYNQSGQTIKIVDDTITLSAPNIIANCDNFTVNSTAFTVNSATSNFNGGTVHNDGVPIDKNHYHTQGSDSDGDSEQDVSTPL